MDGMILSDVLGSVDNLRVLQLIDEENKTATIMHKTHNDMSRKYYIAFIVSTLTIQIFSVCIALFSPFNAPISLIIGLSSINALITGVMFNTLDVSAKSRTHRILARKYNKIKQFCSLRTDDTSKKVYEAIQVLKGEINQLNDLFIPNNTIKKHRQSVIDLNNIIQTPTPSNTPFDHPI